MATAILGPFCDAEKTNNKRRKKFGIFIDILDEFTRFYCALSSVILVVEHGSKCLCLGVLEGPIS